MGRTEPTVFESDERTVRATVGEEELILESEGRTIYFEVDEPDAIPESERVPPWCEAVVRRVGLRGIRERGEA